MEYIDVLLTSNTWKGSNLQKINRNVRKTSHKHASLIPSRWIPSKKPQFNTQLSVASTVGENQSETPIHSTPRLIGSRQRLQQPVARNVA